MFDAMAHNREDPRDSIENWGSRLLPPADEPARQTLHEQIMAGQISRPTFDGEAGAIMHSLVMSGLGRLEVLVSAQYLGDLDDKRVDQEFKTVWTDALNDSTEEPTRVHFVRHCLEKLDGPTEFQESRYLSAAQIVIPKSSNIVLRGLFNECRGRHLPEDIIFKIDGVDTFDISGQEEVLALVSLGFNHPDEFDFR